ncbi:MAG TPA: hypothetical protein VHC22_19130 [Pirellulales bacterium]|nr:hypothetical protein [Pirellulales bacterium]
MPRRFQFSLGDVLLATAVAAVIAATIASREAVVSFIAFSLLLIFVRSRPVLFRLWIITAIGFGSGVLTAMLYQAMAQVTFMSDFRMASDQLAGWGAGMVTGGFVAWRLFLINPPRDP